jgi:triphosphatase
MAIEIELKLAIAPEHAKAVRACAAGLPGAGKAARNRVYNVYFDTPDLLLKRQRMALRMRKLGRKWLETLKTAGSSAGGLHQRNEWEFALPDATLDLSLFKETPLGELKQRAELHTLLKPAFVTDFVRTAWRMEPAPGSIVEMVLDQGTIECEGRHEAICEIEIELIEGEAGALFDVADALVAATPAQPAYASKAERGYRLFQQLPIEPAKAEPAGLDKDIGVSEALKVIVGACITHYFANLTGATQSDNPEFIHQARVSLRRLRSALRVFGRPDGRRFDEELRWLTGALGAARDWDVFTRETWPMLGASLPEDMAVNAATFEAAALTRRDTARREAREALLSPRHAALWLGVMRWLVAEPKAGEATPRLADFASNEIGKRHKRLLRDASNIATLDPEARHEVRIDAKRLRYAADFFRELFKKGRVNAYLDALSRIQDALGKANDAAVAARLVAELAPPAVLKAYLDGWIAGTTRQGVQDLEPLFAELRAAQRFWSAKKTPLAQDPTPIL